MDGKSEIFILDENPKDFQNTGYLVYGTSTIFHNGYNLWEFKDEDGIFFKAPFLNNTFTAVSKYSYDENSGFASFLLSTSEIEDEPYPPEIFLLNGGAKYPSIFNLSNMDISDGHIFRFKDLDHYEEYSTSFSYLNGNFDFNCDGIKDFGVVFDNITLKNTLLRQGEAFVLYGRDFENEILYLNKIEKNHGTKILNVNVENYSPDICKFNSAGDFNEVKCDDLLYSSVGQDYFVGIGYLLLGNDKNLLQYNVSDLMGLNGFKINFGKDFQNDKWSLGVSINSIGDINNDGNDDFKIYAPYVKNEDISSMGFIIFEHDEDSF